jgi:hypothetical protein
MDIDAKRRLIGLIAELRSALLSGEGAGELTIRHHGWTSTLNVA